MAHGMLSDFLSQANNLTKQIISHFHQIGGFAWRNNTVGIFDRSKGIYRTSAKKGVSDILALLRGRFYAIEVKIGRDRLSPEQDGFLQTIQHHQGNAFVVHSFIEFLEELNKRM